MGADSSPLASHVGTNGYVCRCVADRNALAMTEPINQSERTGWLGAAFPRSSFMRHSALLLSGAVTAQAVQAVLVPLVTRLYDPAVVGEWTLVLAVAGLASAIGGFRYEPAIVLAEDDDEAARVFLVYVALTAVTAAVLLVCLVPFSDDIARLLRSTNIEGWLFAAPVIVVVGGLGVAANQWFLRTGQFRLLGFMTVAQAATTSGSQVALAPAFGGRAGGLVTGSIAGLATALLGLPEQLRRGYFGVFRRGLSAPRLWESALKYRRFPFYVVPHGVIATVRERGIVVLLAVFAGTAVTGYYALALRVVYTTMGAVSISLNAVLFKRAADEVEIEALAPLASRLLRDLVLLATPPLTLFAWASTNGAMAVLLGDEWEEAGIYVALITLPSFTFLLSGVFDRMLYVVDKQHVALLIESAYSAASLAVLSSLLVGSTPRIAVAGFAIVSALYHLPFSAQGPHIHWTAGGNARGAHRSPIAHPLHGVSDLGGRSGRRRWRPRACQCHRRSPLCARSGLTRGGRS
jgi:lipopolysaccharide exporter